MYLGAMLEDVSVFRPCARAGLRFNSADNSGYAKPFPAPPNVARGGRTPSEPQIRILFRDFSTTNITHMSLHSIFVLC